MDRNTKKLSISQFFIKKKISYFKEACKDSEEEDFSEEYYDPLSNKSESQISEEEESLYSESDVNEDFCFECKRKNK